MQTIRKNGGRTFNRLALTTTDIYLHPYDRRKKRSCLPFGRYSERRSGLRLKTLQQTVNATKAEDPDTALNRSMLLRLIADGILPYEMHGNRHIVDYDRVKRCLCDRLMLRDSRFGPHLRTVETAMRNSEKSNPNWGLVKTVSAI